MLGDKKAVPTRSSVFWKELISGQVDADRADYLLRDSLHIGVSYGLYDRNMLVNSIVVGESDEAEPGFLAVEEGGWHVAESLVIARYQMFSQVYFHHARRAFDYHLGQATKKILEGLGSKDGLFPPPTSEGLRKFFEYDDCTIFSALKDGVGGEHGDNILNRSQYKCKKSWDRDLSEEELEQAKEAIDRHGGFLDDGAATKWYRLDKDIRIFDEKSKEHAPLSYKSGLIRAMPALPKITRLYISQMDGG